MCAAHLVARTADGSMFVSRETGAAAKRVSDEQRDSAILDKLVCHLSVSPPLAQSSSQRCSLEGAEACDVGCAGVITRAVQHLLRATGDECESGKIEKSRRTGMGIRWQHSPKMCPTEVSYLSLTS